MDKVVLSSAYFPPALYMACIANSAQVLIDPNEHFIKQTYRNRCHILGVNGVQVLSVPVNRRNHMALKDIRISYAEEWQKLHWRSIFSAYGKSPFFEFYRDDLEPIFDKHFEFLQDLNISTLELINELIGLSPSIEIADNYIEKGEFEYDLREGISPKRETITKGLEINFPSYQQVFSDRHGFLENLSILDVLFNVGPEIAEYLSGVVKTNN